MAQQKQYELAVSAATQYLAEQSDEANGRYVFAYTITIRNEGSVAAQLISRHWVITDSQGLVQDFAKAGANIISFHPEASDHVDRTLSLIREHGCKAGLVFNPATPLVWLDHALEKLDLVLLMSVNPGFGGQQFIPSVLPKIAEARRRIAATGRDIWLEVDGGIKVENIGEVAGAGADTFVAGSAIFGAKDYAAIIRDMRARLAVV